MVRTQNTDSEERRSSEFELHEKGYGKRLASIFGLGIGMGVLAAILSLLIGGTSEVAEDATEATGDVGDAASDATGDADSVSDAAGKATEAAGELGSNLAQITQDAADDTANDVSGAANDATEAAGESGSNLAQITQDTADDTANDVSSAANDATEAADEIGSNLARGTQDTADDTANDVSSAANDATEAADEIGSNLARGTQDAADNAANAVSGATISEAVNSLQSGEWDVNQAIAAKPDNPILFDYSSAELTPQGKQTISELAQEIKQLDSEQVAVKLVGYASKTGNPQSNLVLSQYRADTVAEELRNLGVENTIETEGKGYNEPITNIPADNARQQRTEVKLIRVK